MKKVKRPLNHRQRQALATQQLIIDTARVLFLEQGYGATTIEAVSVQAGVAVSTVYGIYKNKRGILQAIREEWHHMSGQREIYQQAMMEHDPQCRLELFAHATRRQWETSASMMAIYESAAAVDAEAAAELKVAKTGRRATISHFLSESMPLLRSDLDSTTVIAIYLSLTHHEVYQELVGIFHWSPDAYESWLAALFKHQFL